MIHEALKTHLFLSKRPASAGVKPMQVLILRRWPIVSSNVGIVEYTSASGDVVRALLRFVAIEQKIGKPRLLVERGQKVACVSGCDAC